MSVESSHKKNPSAGRVPYFVSGPSIINFWAYFEKKENLGKISSCMRFWFLKN